MKARVKATREIVEVEKTILRDVKCYIQTTGEKIGSIYMEYDLDFGSDCDYVLDYWTRLEHQYAGMAMQGILAHEGTEFRNYISQDAMDIAHALVEQLKEKEERNDTKNN